MFSDFFRSLMSFDVHGRTDRRKFVNFFAFWFLISVILFVVCFVLYIISFRITVDFNTFSISQTGEISQTYLSLFVGIAAMSFIFQIWAFAAASVLTVRRLHDINLSGLYYWLLLFSFILLCINDCKILAGFLAYITLGCILFLSFAESYPFSNKYDKIKQNCLKDTNCNGEVSV